MWVVPGYESPEGVFSHLSSAVTCDDGTYNTIADVTKVGTADHDLRRRHRVVAATLACRRGMTELLYLRDAYLREFTATVTKVDGRPRRARPHRVLSDRRRPAARHRHARRARRSPTCARTATTCGTRSTARCRPSGDEVTGAVDWERRHQLMRTHTAMHVLCGVIWNEWGKAVTGGNMEPLEARMDFEFDPLPEGFAARVEELVNAEIAADRPIEIDVPPARHRARRRRPHPHQGQPDPGDRSPRSASSTSSDSTSRPTAARTCARTARSAASRS